MVTFKDYLGHGWRLTPLRAGTKQPFLKDWANPDNAIHGTEGIDKLDDAAGLLLAHCEPPLMTLDVDEFHDAAAWLDKRGIDLANLLQAEDAVQIVSGRSDRAKLLYQLDQPRLMHRVILGGKTVLEFRCADRNGGSLQDVLPPSIHPDTGKAYTWKGDWTNIPCIPSNLDELWRSLIDTPQITKSDKSPVGVDLDGISEALKYIDPDIGYCEWLKVGQAIHDEMKGSPLGFEFFHDWSKSGQKFKSGECEEKWRSFEIGRGVGIGSLFHIASNYGWKRLDNHLNVQAKDNPFGVRNMENVKIQEVNWLWKGMLAKGKVHLLSGNGGRGKTTLMLAIAAAITNGKAFPGEDHDRDKSAVLYISAEDSTEDTLLPRFLAAGGDGSLLNIPTRLITPDGLYFSILDHAQMLANWVRTTQSNLVVLDPGTAFCGSNVDNNNATQIRAVMARLQEVAELSGAAVMVLNHMTKSTKASPVNRVLGSGAWVHASRLVWGVAEVEEGFRVLGLLKSNLGPIDHVYTYTLKSDYVQNIEAQRAVVGNRILGERFSDYSDFEGKSHGRKATEAEVYLRECLSDGPKSKEEVIAGSDLLRKTLERAAKEIGVESDRSGSVHGKAIWSLKRKIA